MLYFVKEDQEAIDRLKTILEEGWVANGNCWEWTGSLDGSGYGLFESHRVHRLSFAIFRHNFRKGSFICHNCDNPRCYNPGHFYEGDYKSNAMTKLKESAPLAISTIILSEIGGGV